MNIIANLKRIRNFFVNRRKDFFTPVFWKKVITVVSNRFNYWDRVSEKDYQLNINAANRRPWCLFVELTNICSANCIFCAYQYQTRKKGVMSDATYAKLLNEYCEIGGGELHLEVIVGDPTLDKKLVERIKQARQRKEITKIRTITNAIFLDQIGIEEFVKSGISEVVISMAVFDKELYTQIYRTDDYERMRANVEQMLKINEQAGSPVEITLAFRSNLSIKETLNLSDYQPLKKYPHIIEFNTDFDTWRGEIKQEDLLEGMNLRPLSTKENDPCFLLYEGPIIGWDGTVGLCGCRDYNLDSELIIGNINDSTLLELWHCEKRKEIIENFKQGIYPQICNECTQYVNTDCYKTKEGIAKRKFIEENYK